MPVWVANVRESLLGRFRLRSASMTLRKIVLSLVSSRTLVRLERTVSSSTSAPGGEASDFSNHNARNDKG